MLWTLWASQSEDKSYPYYTDDQTKAQSVKCLMLSNAANKWNRLFRELDFEGQPHDKVTY